VQLRSRDFIASVDRALSDAGLEPEALELELTEGVFIEERGREFLRELRDKGISIAIDDFGTGFSSLSYLTRLRVDVLKIDRAFVKEIDRGGGSIVAAIVAMAHGLGCSVVAEGVETEAELDFLRAHGCDVLQGFHLGRPVSAEDFQWCDPAGT
jgi:EAL domain-containing protein (putative c-di-GMP-specific phosphodiesterase class I)